MNNLDKKYTALLQDILDNGVEKRDRTGTGTLSVFGRQIRHNMKEGFPLLTTKKMYMKGVITELLWFLRGDTNIKYLVDNDCHIWDGDAYKNFEKWYNKHSGKEDYTGYYVPTKEEFIRLIKTDNKFATEWGDLGPIYGNQWRSWVYQTREKKEDIEGIDTMITGMDVFDGIRYLREFDQVANSIHLLKTDPDSRRNKVSAWNVGEMDQMVLPPCHTDFQFYTRELSSEERWELLRKKVGNDIFKNWVDDIMPFGSGLSEELHVHNIPTRAISLMWNQRSVDTFLGLPFNIASYGLLLEIVAKEVNMVPDELIGNLGDTHLYLNHIEQAKEQIGRDLTDEERYDIWFTNNYETGMERYFDPNNLPNFDDPYYEPTPKRTREPYPLPKLWINDLRSDTNTIIFQPEKWSHEDFKVEGYKSHPTIKAPLSN